MVNLIEKHSQKLLAIIYELFLADDWVSRKKLINKLNISESTFSRYFDTIKNQWREKIGLEISATHGYRVTNMGIKDYMDIVSVTMRESPANQLLHLIIFQPGKKAEFYSDFLKISMPSFNRKLHGINEFLAEYHCQIRVKNGYNLLGENEDELRVFITYYLLLYNNGTLLWMTEAERAELIALLKRCNCYTQLVNQENNIEEAFFLTLFLVHLLRENQDFHFCEPTETDYDITNDNLLLLLSLLKRSNRQTINNVLHYFSTEFFQAISPAELQVYMLAVEKLISVYTTSNNFSVLAYHKEIILQTAKSVYFQYSIFPFDTWKFTLRFNYFADTVKQQDFFFYQTLDYAIQYLSNLTGMHLEYYFSGLVFWLTTKDLQITEHFQQKKS